MAITENVYTVLPGGTITSFTGGTLRYDRSRQCLWLFHDANGMRRFGLNAPYVETNQYLGDGALDASSASDIGVGEHSGYAYGNDVAAATTNQRIFKVDPTTFTTVATFGANDNSLAASAGSAIRFAANKEGVDADGAIYLLAMGIQHGESVLHADGTLLTSAGFGNDEGLLDQMEHAIAITPDPVSGDARFLWLVQPSGGYVNSTLRLGTVTGGSALTAQSLVQFTSGNFASLFGGPTEASAPIHFIWDAVRERIILVAHVDPVAGNDYLAIRSVALAAPTVAIWSRDIDLGGTNPQYSPGDTRSWNSQFDRYFPIVLTEKTAGGDDLSLLLIDAMDGSTFDSGVAMSTSDLVATAQSYVWLESRGTLYWQTGDTAAPVVAFTFTLLAADPDDPEEPEAFDVDTAIILRSSNLTAVMNQLGTTMEALLTNYADKGGDMAFNHDIDMNGYRITNAGNGLSDGDTVTLAQWQELLG